MSSGFPADWADNIVQVSWSVVDGHLVRQILPLERHPFEPYQEPVVINNPPFSVSSKEADEPIPEKDDSL